MNTPRTIDPYEFKQRLYFLNGKLKGAYEAHVNLGSSLLKLYKQVRSGELAPHFALHWLKYHLKLLTKILQLIVTILDQIYQTVLMASTEGHGPPLL